MSTSAVSSSSLYQQLQSYFQARNSDVQQLGQALQSGNLSAAQTAFSNVQSLAQSGPFANGDAFRVSQREQDFNAIGQALQNGDLAGAQTAFASLQSTFNRTTTAASSGGPAQGVGGGAGPEIVVNLSAPSSSGATSGSAAATGTTASGPEIVLNLNNASGGGTTPEQITINIGQASGGAEQVSLSVGPEGSSSPTQFEFNLNPNSNEQIVLNLLGVGSNAGTTTSGSGASGGLSVSA